MVKSAREYLRSLGIVGWIVMGLSLFTALGAVEFYTRIPTLQDFPTWAWILLLIAGLLLAPYSSYRKQKRTIETLSQEQKSNTASEVFTIESDEHDFGVPGLNGYPQSSVRRVLRVGLAVSAIPSRRVESVSMKILDHLIPTDWESGYTPITLPIVGYHYFPIPDSIRQGQYTVKLIAFGEGDKSESRPFDIEVPE